jgi:hypothetical protein
MALANVRPLDHDYRTAAEGGDDHSLNSGFQVLSIFQHDKHGKSRLIRGLPAKKGKTNFSRVALLNDIV